MLAELGSAGVRLVPGDSLSATLKTRKGFPGMPWGDGIGAAQSI